MRGGSNLAGLLRETNLSREQMADRLMVSAQAVHNWCQGRTPISLDRLRLLASVFADIGVPRPRIAQFMVAELEAQGIDKWMLHEEAEEESLPQRETRTCVIIMIWRTGSSLTLPTMAQACRNKLEHLGYRCIVIDCGGSHSFVKGSLNQIVYLNPTGVFLLIPGSLPDPQDDLARMADFFSQRGIAVVFGRFWRDPSRLPRGAGAVCWDARAVAEMGTRILAEAGHRRVGGVFDSAQSVQNRTAQYFKEELRIRNMELSGTAWREGSQSDSDAEEIMAAAAKSTAIFADSPGGLIQVAHVLNGTGVHWPSDISILGVGSKGMVPQMGGRPFTLIDIPIERLGKEAAEVVAHLMSEPHLPLSERFVSYGKEHLVVQSRYDGSIGPPATYP